MRAFLKYGHVLALLKEYSMWVGPCLRLFFRYPFRTWPCSADSLSFCKLIPHLYMRARLARLEAVYAIKLGGVEYIIVKAAWLQKPTKSKTDMYNRMNSIVGPDSVTGCFFCEDPENPDTVFDTKEPFMLADQIASQVVIVKHPCVQTAVVLDPRADFFEQKVEDENPSEDELT